MNPHRRRLSSRCIALIWAVLLVPGLAITSGVAIADPGGNTSGSVSLLVKSRVPLGPGVVAEIASHASKVTYVWPEIGAMAVSVMPGKMGDLTADPAVALVEPDLQGWAEGDGAPDPAGGAAPPATVVPLPGSSGPLQTWNQSMAQTGGTGCDGTGVTVAVVDSGLPQNWTEFLPPDSVDLTFAAGFGAEGNGDFHNPVNAVKGVGGHIGLFPHGLAVSSLIVGFPSDLGSVGGAAPGAKILPIRVLNQFNFGYFSWFTAGILYAAHLKSDGLVQGPLLVNFSIQARGDSAVVRDAIDFAIAKGVVFVTIAGNFGPASGSIAFPGRLPESITAGAAGWVGEGSSPAWFFGAVPPDDPAQIYVADFSGREPAGAPPASLIDVLAPGSFVFGEWLFGPGFSEGREVAFDAVDNFIFGTSFACPHVVGVAAQMLQKNPALTQAQVEALLRSSALPIPPAAGPITTPFEQILPWGSDATGAGLMRGAAAVANTAGSCH